MMKIYKDDFKRFFTCPKWMWLMKNHQSVLIRNWVKQNLSFLNKENSEIFFNYAQDKGGVAKNSLQMRILGGIWFEKLAVDWFKKQYNYYFFNALVRKNEHTFNKLNNLDYQVFFQPWFHYQDCVTQCDVLLRNGDGFDLYEIKGVNETEKNGKRRKYFADLVYQAWILQKCGINLKNVYLVHLNRKYSKTTPKLELDKIIAINYNFNHNYLKTLDLTPFITAIKSYLSNSFATIKTLLSNPNCHEILNLEQANKANKIQQFCTQILPAIPYEHNLLQFYLMRSNKKSLWYFKHLQPNQPNLLDLTQIQLDLIKQQLTNKQIRQVKVIQRQEPIIKNKVLANVQLKEYVYPIYFYDFETCPLPIPLFNYTSSYLQIPFQFSVHVLTNPNMPLHQMHHHEFLVQNRQDARLVFARQLIQVLNKYGPGSMVAYHKSFECGILSSILSLIESQLTNYEKQQLLTIIDNTLDLKDFFHNFNIYLPKFYGSLSIKSVLPAFNPEFTYKNLAIQTGDQASVLYFNYLYKLTNQTVWNQQRSNLLQYCALDTYALAIVFKALQKLITT